MELYNIIVQVWFATSEAQLVIKNVIRVASRVDEYLKVGLSTSKKICLICFNESPQKNDEKYFYFIWKVLFVLKIYKFLSWLFGHVGKQLDPFRSLWRQNLVNNYNILPNIPWSKGNETMEFGQLIEHNKINIFLQKPCRKWCRETTSRPLWEKKQVKVDIKVF